MALIILGGLALWAFADGMPDVGCLFIVVFIVKIKFEKWKNTPQIPGKRKPDFQNNEKANFEALLSQIIRFVDTNARDFEYIYFEREGSNATRKGVVGTIECAVPKNYVAGECIVAVRPNGTALCHNFKSNGNFNLADKSHAHLAYRLAMHYNGKHIVDNADVADFHPTVYNIISDREPSQRIKTVHCIILSMSGWNKHNAELNRQKAERDSIRRC